jgi:maltose/maltodextrin transport system substrate-binding protein/arabinogalactan oligomer/maltooligosaccharide transport system substrate-binding protein
MLRNKLFGAVLVLALSLGVIGNVFAQDDAALVIWADETRAPILEQLGDIFTEEFGVDVVVQQLAFGDIRDNFKNAAPAGEGPDIIVGAHDWLGELVVNGLLEPVNLADDVSENFVDVSLAAFTFDGTLYAVPQYTENVALAYNPEIIEEVPATWEEMLALSSEIVSGSDADAPTYGFMLETGNAFIFYPIQTAFGGYVFATDDAGNYDPSDVGIDSEGTIAAATWLSDMVEAGNQPESASGDTIMTLYEEGRVGAFIAGPWNLERLRLSEVPYAIAAFPAGPDDVTSKPFLGVQGFMISAFSDQKLLAEAFLLDFVASEEIEVTVEFDTADGTEEITGTPMELLGRQRPSAFLPALAMSTDPDFAAFSEAGVEAQAMPAIPEMGSVWAPWGDALNLVAQGQSDAETAMMTAGEQIRTAIEEGSE